MLDRTPFLNDRTIRPLPLRWFGAGRFCPLCDRWSRRFRTFGLVRRPGAQCPRCGSLERHRLVWEFFKRKTDLFDGATKRMLHVAPEPQIRTKLLNVPELDYLSADLLDDSAMVRMDVTDIQYPDASFDVIYCSHVLEHVPDDRKAMRQFRRILRPGGWAVLVVPITAEQTFEDPSVTDPAERERLFGQNDHVRRYGPDFEERLREADFCVERYSVEDVLGHADAREMAVPLKESPVYLCSSPSSVRRENEAVR